MKKIRYLTAALIAFVALSMGACGKKKTTPSGGSNSDQTSQTVPGGEEVAPGTVVDVYLDLGAIGRYKGNKGQEFPDKFLENAIKITGKAGQDALPGKADVTATSGATFSSWVYYAGGGAPTAFDKIPLYKDLVLLANFTGGNGTNPGGGGGTSQPEGSVTYTVTSLPDWIQNDGCVIFAWAWSANDQGSWRTLSYGSNADASFTVEEELTGFLLARCASGTTTPDWTKSDNGAGRVYNKTSDITCTSGTYSYACSEWTSYNPS